MPTLHIVIRAHVTLTIDAHVGGCPRRVRQTRAVDLVLKTGHSRSSHGHSGDECLTRRRVHFAVGDLTCYRIGTMSLSFTVSEILQTRQHALILPPA